MQRVMLNHTPRARMVNTLIEHDSDNQFRTVYQQMH